MLLGKIKLSRRGKLDGSILGDQPQSAASSSTNIGGNLDSNHALDGEYEKFVRSWLALNSAHRQLSASLSARLRLI